MGDGFDFSIYQQPQQQQNPLAMVGGLVDTLKGVNQLKQFQQEFTARKALGTLAQEAVGPDGQMDWDKYGMLISTHPETAWKAPEVLQALSQKKLLDAETFGKKLDQARSMMENYGNAATALLANGPGGVTKQAVVGKIGELYGQGLIDKDRALGMISSLPENPQDLYKYVRGIALQAATQKDSLDKVFGQWQTINSGGTTHGMLVQPGVGPNGQVTPLVEQPNTLTPGEAIQPQETVGAAGGKVVQPRGEAFGAPTGGALQGPGVATPGAAPPGETLVAGPQGGTAAGVGTVTQGPLSGAASAPVPGGMPTGHQLLAELPPTKQEIYSDFGKRYEDLNHAVTMSNNLVVNLNEAEKAMQMGQFGGGSSMRSVMGTIAQATGLFTPEQLNSISNGSLAATKVIEKVMATNVFDVAKQLLGGQGRVTNMDVDILAKYLPNIDTDPRAAHEIINLFKRQARNQAIMRNEMANWISANKDPEKFDPYWQANMEAAGMLDYKPHGPALEWAPRHGGQ